MVDWLSKINAWRAASVRRSEAVRGHDGVEDSGTPSPVFAEMRTISPDRNAEDVLDLGGKNRRGRPPAGRSVEHGNDRQVVLEVEVTGGEGLCLDALGGVDDEHEALASDQRRLTS